MRRLVLASGLVLLLLLTACGTQGSPMSASNVVDGEAMTVLTFEEGALLAATTVIGVHADLGDDWIPSDGGASHGYAVWVNEVLDCSLMLVVASPIAALPHDLPDREGSRRLAERYGPSNGKRNVYLYRVVGGGTVETVSLEATGQDGGRFVIAREFAALKSALMVDIGCGAGVDPREVFEGLDLSATITTGQYP